MKIPHRIIGLGIGVTTVGLLARGIYKSEEIKKVFGGMNITMNDLKKEEVNIYKILDKLDKFFGFIDTWWTYSGGDVQYVQNKSVDILKKLSEPFFSQFKKILYDWYVVSKLNQDRKENFIQGNYIKDATTIAWAVRYIPVVRESLRTMKRQYICLKNKTTQVEPPYTLHLYGYACDIYWYDKKNKKFITIQEAVNLNLYTLFYSHLQKIDSLIKYGGNWTSFKDYPHFYYDITPTKMNEVKAKYVKSMSDAGFICNNGKCLT